ncbi:MAG TPA: AAA family ATPase [Candidatus Sulfotelmatobacter sp.]|nr:AAA family ATPase [Candidatus Sulfotelmatobacter sp.]
MTIPTNTAVPKKKKSLLMTGRELMALKVVPQEWMVDGLLRIGRKRISLLAGKPESGKSCISRQLAVAVAKGMPFLGRQTVRGEVILWQTEECPEDVQASLRCLGYDADKDENILVFSGDASENNVHALRDALEEHPNVKLVVIETLDDLLKFEDIKENSPAREAFDAFDVAVVSKYSHRAAFLALHHIKKREGDRAGDGLLGASVIRGRTDAKWYVTVKSDDDPRRIFHTEVRRGRNIERTILDFNDKTETNTLGMTLAEDRKLGAGKTADRIKEDIIKYFTANPSKTFEQDCLRVVEGNSDVKRKLFKELLASGCLVESGKGSKGSPFIYRAVSFPIEGAA